MVADGKDNSTPACEWAARETEIAMTTLAELEAKVLAAAITEENFARAKSDLRLKNLIENGRGNLEDCAVFLDDDGPTVLA